MHNGIDAVGIDKQVQHLFLLSPENTVINKLAINSKKESENFSCLVKLCIWARDTGQRIPYFDRCQLTITCMSNVKDVRKNQFCISRSTYYLEYGRHVDSAIVAVVPARPRAILPAMKTMRKVIHGCL